MTCRRHLPSALQNLCGLRSHEAAKLIYDCVLGSIPTEGKSRDCNHDKQNRRNRGHGIEGNCSTPAQCFVVDKRKNRAFEKFPELRKRSHFSNLSKTEGQRIMRRGVDLAKLPGLGRPVPNATSKMSSC